MLLAIFGGHALGTLWSSAASWRRAVAVAVAAYSLAYGASINLMMASDSRFAAEAWLTDHVSETATVGAFGPQAYLPRAGAVRFQELEPYWNVVDIVSPEFLVLNAEHAQRARDAEFYRPLLDGTHPEYRPVARFKSPPGVAVLAYDRIFSNGREDQFTNLDKINPDIRVFARRDVSLPE